MMFHNFMWLHFRLVLFQGGRGVPGLEGPIGPRVCITFKQDI